MGNIEQRYRCLSCRDFGLREIWAARTVAQVARHGEIEDCDWRTEVVACDCAAGDRYGYREWRSSGKKLPRFGDSEWHIPACLHDEQQKTECQQLLLDAKFTPRHYEESLSAWDTPLG